MSKPFILLSVPHTGTNFLWRLLASFRLHGACEVGVPGRGLITSGRDFLQFHSAPTQFHGHDVYELEKCVVPLRHPYKGGVSWINQGMSLELYIEYWETLLELIEKFDTFIFPIDPSEECRAILIDNLANFVGARERGPFEWKPVNESRGPIKDEYLKTGNLPFNPEPLKFALEFYDGHKSANCS